MTGRGYEVNAALGQEMAQTTARIAAVRPRQMPLCVPVVERR